MNDLAPLLKRLSSTINQEEKIDVVIGRAARRAGLSYSRAFNIWYGKARRIEPHERAAILAAIAEQTITDEKNEHHEIAIRLARAEARLSQLETALNRAVADRDLETIEKVFRAVA